jgi:hypothetical protein
VVEEAQKAEAEAQRLKEKAEERARFASTPPKQAVPISSWASRQLKVIVKVAVFRVFAVMLSQCVLQAANYILHPGQEYTGSWHIEGMVSTRSRELNVSTQVSHSHMSALSLRRSTIMTETMGLRTLV